MVYISKDGKIHNKQPWTIRRLGAMCWAFLLLIWMFLKTMVQPLIQNLPSGSGTSGGGGRGGGNGRGPPPGPPTNKRIGRIGNVGTLKDCSSPGGG